MDTSDTLFVGVKGHVIAFSKRDGTELWKTQLKGGLIAAGSLFVTVLVEGQQVYAHTCGELFCLDAATGELLWTNELAGLGHGIATLAIPGASSPPLVTRLEQEGSLVKTVAAMETAVAIPGCF